MTTEVAAATPFESCECGGRRRAIEAAAGGGSKVTCPTCGRSRTVAASAHIELTGDLEVDGPEAPVAASTAEGQEPEESEAEDLEAEAGEEDEDPGDAIDRLRAEHSERVRADLAAAAAEVAAGEAEDEAAREDEEHADADGDDAE